MKNRIITLSIRQIIKTYKRFLSLAILSFLGVGVFVGIKMASPDMIASLDTYYDSNNMYDIKVISTLGLTNKDILSLQNLNTDFNVYGLHSKDIEIKTQDTNVVIRLMEINDNVNKIQITKGRMPEKSNEILVEDFMLDKAKLKIGDIISLDNFDEDNTLNSKEFKIVGTVRSPIYIINGSGNLNRGNTTVGNGNVNFYAYALDKTFNMDYYTEIYLTVENNYLTDSEEYNNLIGKAKEQINLIKYEREVARKQELLNEANNKINEEELKYLDQFKNAKKQLDEAENEIKNGEQLLFSSEKELENAKQQLDEKSEEINNAYSQLEDAKIKLEEGKQKLDSGIEEINNKVSKYGWQYENIVTIKNAVERRDITREEFKSIIPNNLTYYDTIIKIIDYAYDNNYYTEFKKFLDNEDTQKFINLIKELIDKYADTVDALNTLKTYINNVKQLFNGINEIENGLITYNESIATLNKTEEKLDEGYNEFLKYQNEYQKGLQDFNKGKDEYNKGLELYNSNLAEYNARFNEFEENIKKAREDANTIPKADWFINTRKDNNDYNTFIDCSESVDNLSVVFPTIFFAVAIFISLLSMSRMAMEDRTEIGALKSLGYNNLRIRSKYIIYSLLATFLGGILGEICGLVFLPNVIFNTYKIMFDVPVFIYSKEIMPAIIGMIISIICICGATILTINGLIKEKTTELLRPKAPLKGKQILLEKISFIWKKIKFSNKITIRNILRYKKRIGMTVLGIIGCTTLLLSGYAIKDSIVNIADKHFTEVFTYDDVIALDGKQTKEELDDIFAKSTIKSRLDVKMVNVKLKNKSAGLIVPEDVNKIDEIIKLNDKETKDRVYIQKGEVIITSKLAKTLKLKENDTIEFQDADNNTYKFKISGISQSYVGHYIYMDKETFEKNIDKFNVNSSFIKLADDANEDSVLKELLKNEHVLTFSSASENRERVSKMFLSLDNIVLILVVFSGVLSFVVLYNLSYINISERQREIATLKVLGFNHKEIDSYILKEEVIITVIGIILGLLTGTWFGMTIVETIELEIVEFIKNITPLSYVFTIAFMVLFAVIVNIKVHFTLKKINMIESLKSVE